MSILVLKLPDVKGKTEERPRGCPYCQGETFQRWGKVKKPVKDIRQRKVQVYRYRCCQCRRTFRHYPAGSSRADQTDRLRMVAVICWRLGMSYRGVAALLQALRVNLSHMSVWREAQEQARQIAEGNRWRKVRVLGVDGAYVLGWGEKRPVLVAVDLGSGEPVALGYVDEKNPAAVRRWLAPLAKRLKVGVIVTDDLQSYRIVAKELELGHQICQFHVRRWVGREIRDLREQVPREYLEILDKLEKLLADLPQDGARHLYALWKYLPGQITGRAQARIPLERLRNLLIRLSETWEQYCQFYGEVDVPWTNNGTEQAIGRMKMRARTVRGYKNWPGMQAGLLLAGTAIQ